MDHWTHHSGWIKTRILHNKDDSVCLQFAEILVHLLKHEGYHFIAKTYGVVVFDDESLGAGVMQLLESPWVTPGDSGSLSNTIKSYVLTIITHVEFNYVSYGTLRRGILFSLTNSHFILFVLCWLLELGGTSQMLLLLHCGVMHGYKMQQFHWLRNSNYSLYQLMDRICAL